VKEKEFIRVISGLHGLALPGLSMIVLQKGDELENAEDDQDEPGVHQRAEVDFKPLMTGGERKVRVEGEIKSIPQKNDEQPTEIACHGI
jgi:hypothetical protein